MVGKSSLQRIVGLLFLMLVLCAGGPPAIAGHGSHGAAGASVEDYTGSHGRTAAVAPYDELDGLTGTPNVPVGRPHVLWFVHAVDRERGASSPLRQPSAHDPPKTIRFCTLLI